MVRIKLAGFLCFPDSSNKVCAPHQRVQKGTYIFENVSCVVRTHMKDDIIDIIVAYGP